jgi:hypothetical protein
VWWNLIRDRGWLGPIKLRVPGAAFDLVTGSTPLPFFLRFLGFVLNGCVLPYALAMLLCCVELKWSTEGDGAPTGGSVSSITVPLS